MNNTEWIWMPHPAHFICAFDCRFHLATYVNGFIVSTVGELFPDAPVREIYAQSRGIMLSGRGDDRCRDYMQKIGYEDIGYNRKYETMVFKAEPNENICCPYRIESGTSIDMEGYNDPGDATKGHMALCLKYSDPDIRLLIDKQATMSAEEYDLNQALEDTRNGQ